MTSAQDEAVLLRMIKSEGTGDMMAMRIAKQTKDAYKTVMESIESAMEEFKKGEETIPPSRKYKAVEAIHRRLCFELRHSFDRAYVDLDAILHGQDVVIDAEWME